MSPAITFAFLCLLCAGFGVDDQFAGKRRMSHPQAEKTATDFDHKHSLAVLVLTMNPMFASKPFFGRTSSFIADNAFSTPRVFRHGSSSQMASDFSLVPVIEHEKFLREVALITPPPALSAVVGILVSRGEEVAPLGDPSVHPYLLPLTRDPRTGVVTGLLHPGLFYTQGDDGSWPVVRTSADGRQLNLLANSAELFVAHAAVTADAEGSSDAAALAELSTSFGIPYTIGTATASAGGVLGYLAFKVGPFPDVYEALANRRLENSDEIGALVTCDRIETLFDAWGWPLAHHARMFERVRPGGNESRDKARRALTLFPLWTLGDNVSYMIKLAQSDAESISNMKQSMANGSLSLGEIEKKNINMFADNLGQIDQSERTAEEIVLDRANALLDSVVIAPDVNTWESIRPVLAELLKNADMASMSSFVSLDDQRLQARSRPSVVMEEEKSPSIVLDPFAARNFLEPGDASKGSDLINFDKDEFAARVNAHYDERVAAGEDPLQPGYAPFCKHIFMPNFVPGLLDRAVAVTSENEHLLKSGYIARNEKELPVLSRWFPETALGKSTPEAKFLDVILYSREQIRKENEAMNTTTLDNAPWGIVSIKPQSIDTELPMEPITLLRNALGKEHGGSGVNLDPDAYARSVDFWSKHARVK